MDKSKDLPGTLSDIHIQHEDDMQAIADQLELLNEEYQKNIEQTYKRFNTPLPKRYERVEIRSEPSGPLKWKLVE